MRLNLHQGANLCCNNAEHICRNAAQPFQARPCTSLRQAGEYAADCVDVHPIGAVEHRHIARQCFAKVLRGWMLRWYFPGTLTCKGNKQGGWRSNACLPSRFLSCL